MKKIACIIGLLLASTILFSGCGTQSIPDNVISGSSRDSEDKEDVNSDGRIVQANEQDFIDYFDHIANTYHRNFVFDTPEEVSNIRTYLFLSTNLTNDYTIVRYKDLPGLISDAELKEFTQFLDDNLYSGYWFEDYDELFFTVQYVEDMQKGFDELWGKGSIDIQDILETNPGYGETYLSETGILLHIYDSYTIDTIHGFNSFYEITEINMVEDIATLSVLNVIVYEGSFFTEYGYAIDGGDPRLIGNEREAEWVDRNKDASFDEVVSYFGIDRSTISEYKYSIRNTPDGFEFVGLEKIDHKNYPSDLVIPSQILNYYQHCLVDADDGLNLRKGPGAEYDMVTLLPDESRINLLGENSYEEGWIFVSYTLDGTEYFGWTNREFVQFYD